MFVNSWQYTRQPIRSQLRKSLLENSFDKMHLSMWSSSHFFVLTSIQSCWHSSAVATPRTSSILLAEIAFPPILTHITFSVTQTITESWWYDTHHTGTSTLPSNMSPCCILWSTDKPHIRNYPHHLLQNKAPLFIRIFKINYENR